MRNLFASAFIATAFIVASTAPALAAPQILAVISSLGPQKLYCSGSTCATTITSYCLQRERDVPATGHAYQPAHPDQFTLNVIAADGSEKALSAGEFVKFRSQRGYAAVRAVVGRDILESLGGTNAYITMSARAALVPTPVAGDPNPISEAELAFATQSLREHGEGLVDSSPEAEAASIVNRIATTIVPSAVADPKGTEQLWQDVIDGLGPARPANADAIHRARDIYDWCQTRMTYHSMGGIQSCLEFKHDNTIMRLNSDYWDSQPGY